MNSNQYPVCGECQLNKRFEQEHAQNTLKYPDYLWCHLEEEAADELPEGLAKIWLVVIAASILIALFY